MWVDSAGSQLLSGQGRAVRWAQEEDKIIEGYIKTVARTETISFTVIGGVAMAYELRCFLVAVSRKRPCSCVRRYEGTFVRKYFRISVLSKVRKYFRTKVLPYESSSCSVYVLCSTTVRVLYRTKVRRYFRTFVRRTKVLPYTCTSYMYVQSCTVPSKVLSYFRTKVQRTFVLSKIEYESTFESTFVVRTAVHVGLHVYSCTRTLKLLLYSDKYIPS